MVSGSERYSCRLFSIEEDEQKERKERKWEKADYVSMRIMNHRGKKKLSQLINHFQI